MTDKRPVQLVESIKTKQNKNDKAIEDALDTLQRDVKSGVTKPTMDNLVNLCGLSEGAIRKRRWAVLRLKAMKKSAKSSNEKAVSPPKSKSEVNLLRERVRDLLKENAILFEEAIGLKGQLERRDREIQVLEKRLIMKIQNHMEKE
ncbi:hypothetical protein NUW46_04520 [Marinobacter sp. MA]|uniref:hypothetical protein n=1 Tax=Marinobacter sp. MA TaxID=2971606 RepID=UPI003AACDD3C